MRWLTKISKLLATAILYKKLHSYKYKKKADKRKYSISKAKS